MEGYKRERKVAGRVEGCRKEWKVAGESGWLQKSVRLQERVEGVLD